MLKAIIKSLEEVEEAHKGLYKKNDNGEYVLQVEGLPDNKGKLDEFRQNNLKLTEQLDEMKNKLSGFDGLDVDAAKKALKLQEELENKVFPTGVGMNRIG